MKRGKNISYSRNNKPLKSMLERNGPWEEATNVYNRAIELSPNNATFHTAKESSLNMLALITNNQSKRNESVKALNPYPLDAGFWYSRGIVLKVLGLNSDTDAAFSKAEEMGRVQVGWVRI